MSVQETSRARDLRVRREVRRRLVYEINRLYGYRSRFCRRWPEEDQPVVHDELLKQMARLLRFSEGAK